MARLLHTNDPYTTYTSYDTIDDIYTSTSYDAFSNSYNITLRNSPLCFFVNRTEVSTLTIKDNSGPFLVDLSSNDSNFFCTSVPRPSITTELIIQNGEEEYIYVVPDSVVDTLFGLDMLGYDPNTQTVVNNDEINDFCSVMGTPISGELLTCTIPQKPGTISLTDVSLTEIEKQSVIEGFNDILQGILILVFLVFFGIFVKKLLSHFWN